MLCSLRVLLGGVFFFAAIYHIQAATQLLQCWHCSSDTIGAEDFCDIGFEESSIPTDLMKERNISIVRSCNSTIHSEHERAVCRKTVEEANGKTVTKRFCYYTNKSDPLDHCSQESTDKSVRRVFCEDCLTDKCNAGSRHSHSILGALVLSAFLAGALVV